MLGPEKSEEKLPAGAREHLTRVLASPLFERSPRQSAFLRFVVEKVLAGEADQIKEYEIAVNVYDRRTDHSTRVDPIVRVEAARLRSKLLEYYATEGRDEPLRIELPKGAYVPEFVEAPLSARVSIPETPLPAEEPARSRRNLWWVAAFVTTAVAWLALMYGTRPKGSPLAAPDSKIPSSIAIIPFQAGPDQQLGQQMTEAMIADMRQRNSPHWHIRSVVINGDPSLPEQHADAIFHGTVSLNDGVLHATGSLEHRLSKIVLWNGTVDRKLESDPSLTFEDVAYTISESMNVALMERQEQELATVYPRRAQARHDWLEADPLWRRGDIDSVRRSIGLLEKATALDPNFGWIHATLAFAYSRAVELGFAPEALYRRRAHEESDRALELGPYLPPAHASAIHIAFALDGNMQAAEATCTSALNMLSSSYSIRDQCAELFSLEGKSENAAALEMRSIRRAKIKIVPITELALVHYRARQFADAELYAGQALAIDANYVPARRIQALAAMQHPEQALAFLRIGTPDSTGRLASLAATALALQGHKADAELQQAERELTRPYRTDLIRPYLALGQTERAKAVIEEGVKQKNVALLELAVDPQIAELDRTRLFDMVRSIKQ